MATIYPNSLNAQLSEARLSEAELSALHRVVLALKNIRYGSVILTVHEGRIVEVQKTERLRVKDNLKDNEHE